MVFLLFEKGGAGAGVHAEKLSRSRTLNKCPDKENRQILVSCTSFCVAGDGSKPASGNNG
jgi:hypothetical protein